MSKLQTNINNLIHNISMEKIFQIVTIASLLVALFATVSLMAKQANGQEVFDKVAEDEVIVCINGNVIDQSGNICKVFAVDGDGYFQQEITLNQVQEDLYKNPESDTFKMDVRD